MAWHSQVHQESQDKLAKNWILLQHHLLRWFKIIHGNLNATEMLWQFVSPARYFSHQRKPTNHKLCKRNNNLLIKLSHGMRFVDEWSSQTLLNPKWIAYYHFEWASSNFMNSLANSLHSKYFAAYKLPFMAGERWRRFLSCLITVNHRARSGGNSAALVPSFKLNISWESKYELRTFKRH